jgi:glycosyltransferase involved in cell wall biosynthesis
MTRVLHVNKYLYRRGGAEGYVADVAALQVRSGHEVAFFSMDHPENPPSTYEDWFPEHVDLEPPPPSLQGRARAVGRMLWSRSARSGIAHVIDRFEPDVAHLHNVYHQLSPSVIDVLAQREIPMVMTVHDYKLVCPNYQMSDHGQPCHACVGRSTHHAIVRRCKDHSVAASAVLAIESGLHRRMGVYDAVDRLICPSRFMAGLLLEGGFDPARFRVVTNPVDPALPSVAHDPHGPIVYAGRLSYSKGVDVLIEAVGRLQLRPRLQIIGAGPERVRLEQLADRVAPGRVDFLGRLPVHGVLDHLARASVSVLPTRGYENQPLAVLESFACGVPVIASAIGGLPELLDGEANGWLVPPDDVDALTMALLHALTDVDVLSTRGRQARAHVERHHDPASHLARLDEIYAELTPSARRLRHV